MTRTIVNVAGMSCDHCRAAVTEEVGRIDGVTAVEVDLASGRVEVASDGPVPPAALAVAVDEAGYELVAP